MYSNWPGGGELIASILAIGNAAPRFQMTNHRGAQGIDDNWMNMVTILCVLVVTFMLPAWPAFAQDVVLYDGPQVQIMPSTAVPAEVSAQQRQGQQPQDQQPAPGDNKITIPAGTRLSLALYRPLSFKHTRPGDSVNLQFVFPVTNGNRMVIPPGTYVQGVIDQITRHDRYYEVLAIRLRSADVIFATGYIVTISGPLDVTPTYGKLAAPDSPRTSQAPVMAAAGGANTPTLPPLPPLPHIGPSPGVLIGVGVGIAAAGTVTALVLYHHRDFVMEAGTPVEITLASPLVLDESSVSAAVQQFSKAPPEIVKPARRMRTCWTTGTPDYPSTPYPCPY